ncbi:hypothetical protein [Psychrobacter immobilis]|uniref:hypothetical protein n=1 Tax=Psychrobacter immobilis TaxID=498 RepID=UPI00191A05FD|nr:hypothetical protein [Psychrobacter immobilis]
MQLQQANLEMMLLLLSRPHCGWCRDATLWCWYGVIDANGDVIHSSATAISNADGKAVFNINEVDLTFDNNGNLRVYLPAL